MRRFSPEREEIVVSSLCRLPCSESRRLCVFIFQDLFPSPFPPPKRADSPSSRERMAVSPPSFPQLRYFSRAEAGLQIRFILFFLKNLFSPPLFRSEGPFFSHQVFVAANGRISSFSLLQAFEYLPSKKMRFFSKIFSRRPRDPSRNGTDFLFLFTRIPPPMRFPCCGVEDFLRNCTSSCDSFHFSSFFPCIDDALSSPPVSVIAIRFSFFRIRIAASSDRCVFKDV